MKDSAAIPPIGQSKVFYGWWVVGACALIALAAAVTRYAFSIFMPYMLQDLGWTRAAIGAALTLHMIVYAVGAVFIGRLTDKYGSRWIMSAGGILLMAGLAVMSRIDSIWQFYIGYSFIAALGVTATYIVPNTATARQWFFKKAGLAVALVLAGSGLGLAVISPISPYLIERFGWRTSYLIIGFVVGFLAILASVFVVRKNPESMGLLPDGEQHVPQNQIASGPQPAHPLKEERWTVKEALGTRSFWMFLMVYPLGAIALMGVLAHIAAWGFDIAKMEGMATESVGKFIGTAMMVMALCATGSRLVTGPLSDRVGRKPIIYASYAIQILVFAYAVQVDSLSGFMIFAVANGIAYGAVMPLWVPFVADIFGRFSIATLMGMLTFTGGVINGLGPVIFGWIFDKTGSYSGAFIFGIVTFMVSIILVSMIKPVSKKKTGASLNIATD
ncbi:MAG: MFS transporter [Desulfobacterales bacterium]